MVLFMTKSTHTHIEKNDKEKRKKPDRQTTENADETRSTICFFNATTNIFYMIDINILA